MAQKSTKLEFAFKYEELESKLSGLTPSSAYYFTKRNNPTEFNNLMGLLPEGYINKQKDNIELLELVYSVSSTSPFLLTLAVGRNDTFKGEEKFDIDVINIAPDTTGTASYFRNQWHHFKDENGKRISYDINPFIIGNEEQRKDVTYGVFLTGSTTYFSLDDYHKERPSFYDIHVKSFGDIKI